MSPSPVPAFALRGVSKRYEAFTLHPLDLELAEGQIMGLVGVNGAGKSTLLRLLAGLSLADGGQLEVLGHRLPEQQVQAKQHTALASEDMRMYGSQTLSWHFDFVRRMVPQWDGAYAEQLRRRFDLPADQRVAGFSHGQRVKALLLLVLARRTRLLLLDEPTTGLDPVARAEVLDALAEVLMDERRSVLFSSHQTGEVERLADRIAFLHQGRLLTDEAKDSYLERWRRIVGHGYAPDDLGDWPEVAQCRRNGSLVELRVRAFSPGLQERLQARGMQIHQITPLTLEDIFVSTVREHSGATA
ncbi:ATP-binding cassette domain-containing protein [Kinneretia aquatilis]|uniref:ATP-binding cassette domain-containing protein n=1 Tax=Kinneretia aquatilis TaxID=2070761 RepID=UPI00149516D9|nr:ABC transporter ATP-binding protein [Paucibacter aquatile]WIV99094.1 ABC transporter ATP-binding protein [Paucibacter aquatile]